MRPAAGITRARTLDAVGWRAHMDAVRARRIAFAILGLVLLAARGPRPPSRPREGAPVVVDPRSADRGEVRARDPTPPPPPARPVAAPGQTAPHAIQPSTPTPSASAAIVATDGAGADLRTDPSMRAPIITTLAEGTPVDALEDTVSAEGRPWRKIRGGDREGWVVAVVVLPRDPEGAAATTRGAGARQP